MSRLPLEHEFEPEHEHEFFRQWREDQDPPMQFGPRRGVARRVAITALSVLVMAVGISILSIEGTRSRTASRPQVTTATLSLSARARADALAFLDRYETPNGRVVRTDQGGDTVSEGQGYAMLLAAATGQQSKFASAWQWDQQNLQLPDGLFAYHWSGGKVVDDQPAADADLATAWALVLASRRFNDPDDLTQGLRIANAILTNETVSVDGQVELVAGPWGRGSPAVADPSYLSPEAMGALEGVTGVATWGQLAADSTALLTSFTGKTPARLPSNWVDLESNGAVQPIGSPSGTGTPQYGLDAQRVPVWFAAGCSGPERAVAAADWPLLKHSAGEGAHISYSLAGGDAGHDVNPLGLVAAAAAASAAGAQRASSDLLDRADQQSQRFHTYYGDAWTALGRILLDTDWLSPCAPSLAPSK
jgi:endoglucanase